MIVVVPESRGDVQKIHFESKKLNPIVMKRDCDLWFVSMLHDAVLEGSIHAEEQEAAYSKLQEAYLSEGTGLELVLLIEKDGVNVRTVWICAIIQRPFKEDHVAVSRSDLNFSIMLDDGGVLLPVLN